MIADGESGFCVRPGDHEAIASRLVSLLSDDDLRARMASASRARFERLYGAEAYGRSIKRLYTELVGRGSR